MRKKHLERIVITILIVLVISVLFNAFLYWKFFYYDSVGDATFEEFEHVAEKTTPSVVLIVTDSAAASGVIVRPDGYVMTNDHVISGAGNISVRLIDGRIYSATLIGSDPKADIAILKVNGNNLPAIEFGDSEQLEIGEKVIAIGNPFGYDFTVTTGIISAKHREQGPTEYRDFLQTDASINPGNSGGPLIDLNGRLVGINTFIVSGTNVGEVGFAIPVNLAKAIMGRLINFGKVERGYFGISVKDRIKLDDFGNGKILPGVEVVVVENDSTAGEAGILVGDIILEINYTKIEKGNQLRNIVAWLPINESVDVRVIRDSEEIDLDVKVDPRPDNP